MDTSQITTSSSPVVYAFRGRPSDIVYRIRGWVAEPPIAFSREGLLSLVAACFL